MAYITYTTKALVCGTYDNKTSDRSYLLFTREAGMLYASARSVRVEKSKQRYALQDFSLVRVSLIKGKGGWKIGSIESGKNYYHLALSKEARGSVVSLCRLLRRFVKGEEAAVDLFDYVITSFEELLNVQTKRSFVQTAIHVHVLAYLGYVDKKLVSELINESSPQELSLQYSEATEKRINNIYIHASSISHL